MFIAIWVANAHSKTVLSSIETQMKEQVRHYDAFIKKNEELRKFHHDYKNLQIGLTSLLADGDISGALSYLQEHSQYIQPNPGNFKTGNFIADVLLAEKQKSASSMKAVISFDGLIPNRLITPIDICIILGNTLDNAIEACCALPPDDEKCISILAFVNNGFLFLTIQNPVVTRVPIHNNRISSSKKDKSLHGFGLLSIKQAIQKYNGDLELSCTEAQFETKISLYLNTAENIAKDIEEAVVVPSES